jgi:hypothetical protein
MLLLTKGSTATPRGAAAAGAAIKKQAKTTLRIIGHYPSSRENIDILQMVMQPRPIGGSFPGIAMSNLPYYGLVPVC